MSSRRKIRIIVAFAIMLAIIPLFFANRKVSAATPTNALTKYEAYGLHMCIVNKFKESFSSDEITDIDHWYHGGTEDLIKDGQDDNYVSLPAEHGLSGDDDDRISCSKLSSNLIGKGSKNDENPYDGFTDLLEKFGYEKQGDNNGSRCAKYKFKYIAAGEEQFYDAGYVEYCETSVNNNGSINSDSRPTTGRYGNSAKEEHGEQELHIGYLDASNSDKITFCVNPQQESFSGEDCDEYDDEDKRSVSRSSSWNEITNSLDSSIKDVYSALSRTGMGGDLDGIITNYSLSPSLWLKYDSYEVGADMSDSATANSTFSYEIKSPLNTFYAAYNNLFGVEYSPYNFDEPQQAALYQNYLLSYWAAEKTACADTLDASKEAGADLLTGPDDNDEYYHQTKLYNSDGTAQYCYVKTEKYNKKVYGIENGLPADNKIGFAAVAKWLLDNGPDSINPEELVQTPEEESGNRESAEPTCQNQGGAGSLGWIVCSILDWMKSATVGLYNDVVEPSLNVQPELFTEGGESSGAQKAWGIFRDFANILFVILTLFVIFSQLTGVGIDNYGIKKILPKLVIAAVLINLSYIICLICVDLSNIVGNGVQELLNNINMTDSTDVMDATGVNIGADVGIVAVGVTAAAIGVYAIYSNPALLLTLFIAVLGVFIAVLFIFILLAGRKAAIILLTVVSPIAFILYMLPNTKKIYDKWFNLWKAMLLVYPICGLLIGGGNFASKLMLTIGDNSEAITAFTAMVVGIVPIFFIPTVIRGAYSALGSIGGTIAGFGGRLRGGFTRRASNSQAYQRAQKRSQDRSQRIGAMRRAGVRLDRDGNVVASRRPTAQLRRRMAGTWAGRRLGMEASMGQSFNEFAKAEVARRGGISSSNIDAMNATFAGIAEKEAAQRVSDQETLIKAGKVQLRDGTTLNVNNADGMRTYHGQLLGAAHQALANGNTAAYNSYMDQIKAAQNLMAKSDRGRQDIQTNYENAASGSGGGLADAAAHLLDAHGATIKASNKSMFKLSQDLTSGTTSMADIERKVRDNVYDRDSIQSYSPESLAAADDAALDRLKDAAAATGTATMTIPERQALAKLIDDLHSKKNLNIQGKVKDKIDAIDRELGRSPAAW